MNVGYVLKVAVTRGDDPHSRFDAFDHDIEVAARRLAFLADSPLHLLEPLVDTFELFVDPFESFRNAAELLVVRSKPLVHALETVDNNPMQIVNRHGASILPSSATDAVSVPRVNGEDFRTKCRDHRRVSSNYSAIRRQRSQNSQDRTDVAGGRRLRQSARP